jgi:protein-tyrosine phosphatase
MAEHAGVDVTWVHEHLAIGGSFVMSAVPHLAELGVRHVIDVRDRSTDDVATMLANGMDFLHLPLLSRDPKLQGSLQRGVHWAAPRIERGEKVLIHCEYGTARSVLLGLCTLVRAGAQPREALIQLKQARPCASPSPDQLEAFIEWCVGESKRTPSWDDLARIAYSSALSVPPQAMARALA